jgi:serine/threonine-protein phosphatase 2A regulatory subunit A
LADKIAEVAKFIDKDFISQSLTNFYANFLQDPEAEVRFAATTRLADFCSFIDGAMIVRKVIPPLKILATDSFNHVRSKFFYFAKQKIEALSENLLSVAPLIGTANTNEHVIPMFLSMLKDASAEVRLPLLKNLENLNKV